MADIDVTFIKQKCLIDNKPKTFDILLAPDEFFDNFQDDHSKKAAATIIASRKLFNKSEIKVSGIDDINFPLVIIRKCVWDMALDEERQALVKHELAHWKHGHGTRSLDRKLVAKQEAAANSELTKDDLENIEILMERLLIIYGTRLVTIT